MKNDTYCQNVLFHVRWINMAASNDGSEYFNTLADKITNLFFGRTSKDLKILESALDELNSINYRCAIVTSETVTHLINLT